MKKFLLTVAVPAVSFLVAFPVLLRWTCGPLCDGISACKADDVDDNAIAAVYDFCRRPP
jgi:hypothetical protein